MLGPALLWKMGGDTSDFNKKIGGAGKRAGKLKSILKSIGPAFSVGFMLAGLTRLTAEFDKTAKTARKLGVAPELLQEMRYAAERTGVAQTALDMGLQRFTRRMAEAAQGGGELKGVLEQYDIAVKNADGTTRANVDVLGDLAEVIKNTKDPAEQLRIAFKAFDSEGAAMVNTLRGGKEGLDELRQAARDAGAVVGGEALSQFEKLSDQMLTVKASAKGLVGTLGGAFLTFGERVGQGAAMAVNALQGIPTVLEDDVPEAVDVAVGSIADIEGSIADVAKAIETLATIAESKRKSAFDELTTRAKITALLEREVEIFNTQVAPHQKGSKKWNEGMLALEKIRIQLAKEKATLSKEEAAAAAAALKSLAEHKALNLELLKAQMNGDKILIANIEERIKKEERIAEIMKDTNVDRATAVKLTNLLADAAEGAGEGASKVAKETEKIMNMAEKALHYARSLKRALGIDSDVGAKSSEDLQAERNFNEAQLKEINRQVRGNRNASGGTPLTMKFEAAIVQAQLDAILAELATRDKFKAAEQRGSSGLIAAGFTTFDEVERLRSIIAGQTDGERQTSILQSIDDRLALQNDRQPIF